MAPQPEWISTLEELSAVVTRHRSAPYYALDTEFISGERYRPVLALVQLCVEERIYLIDALHCPLDPLAQLFASDATLLAHAAANDLELLELRVGAKPSRLFDTQVAGQLLGLATPSLGSVVAHEVGLELDKSSRMSDWTHRPLSTEQLRYAATDVVYLARIYHQQTERLRHDGKLEWCEQECERLRLTDRSWPHPDDAWMRLRGAATLSPSERRRARALAAWREQTARERDRVASKVWSDESLMVAVRRPPATVSRLTKLRGTEHLSDADRTQIVATVAAAATAPEVTALVDPRDERAYDALISLMTASVWQLGHRGEVDPALLASRADLVAWVSQQRSRLDDGWRRDHLVPVLEELMAGNIALRVADSELALVRLANHELVELRGTARA